MRIKVVPPPRGLETLRAVQGAVPLVPGSVEDCCARVVDRAAVPSRDEAREWLTFLRALGLVEETTRGFRRSREEPAIPGLADAFRDGVYGVEEVLARVADAPEPASVEDVATALTIPGWERRHHQDADAVWRERIERLLGWAVTFELLEETAEGYRA